MSVEKTLSIIKPDATKRNLTGLINTKFEKAGLRINQESYERERVSDEVNDKLNEIFDSLEDSTKH